MNKIKTEKRFSIESAQKIFWALGVHAFWVVLFFIFLDILIGVVLFYKYVTVEAIDHINESSASFKYDLYEKIINKWDKENYQNFHNSI